MSTGLLAPSADVAIAHARCRRVLAVYMLAPEHLSLLDAVTTEASETGDGVEFAWDAARVRALGLVSTWHPPPRPPLVHPTETQPAPGGVHAKRALAEAGKRCSDDRRAVLLRLGAPVRPATQSSSSTDRACDAASGMPKAIRRSTSRRAAALTSRGFSNLAARPPRDVDTQSVPLDSLDISLARMRGEAFLATAAETLPVVLHKCECGEEGDVRPPTPSSSEFLDIATPCVLHATPHSAAARTGPADGAAAKRTVSGPNAESGEELIDAASSLHNLSCEALPSTHDLPSQGNWIRLAAAQQAVGTQPARAAIKPTARTTFGTEARLSSASRRWSHQTALPFTRRLPAREEARQEDAPVAGSFLPLRLATRSEVHAPQPGRCASAS